MLFYGFLNAKIAQPQFVKKRQEHLNSRGNGITCDRCINKCILTVLYTTGLLYMLIFLIMYMQPIVLARINPNSVYHTESVYSPLHCALSHLLHGYLPQK